MQIGELAKRAGCTVEVVRFYESEQILPLPRRHDNGYRDFDATHVQRLAFVRRCRDLDISLNDIRQLIKFADDPQTHCQDVNLIVDAQIQKIKVKLNDIKALQVQLKNLRRKCNGETLECSILSELSLN